MAAQKLILSLVIVAIAAIITQVNSKPQVGLYAANNTNKSHDFVIGYRLPGDRPVLKQSIVKNSSWMKVVIVEKTFTVPIYERITMIQALDQKTNGNGAYASISGGGPGYNNVTLRFKSQRSHGINFIVQIFSRY